MHSLNLMKKILLALSITAALVPWQAGHAEVDFPHRPLTIVVPFAPGGAMDLTARSVGQRLAMELGQPVVIENVIGAGGAIGTQTVARATPDGYTLLISNQGPNVIREILYPETTYRTAKDFVAISTLTTSPLFLATRAKSPLKTLQDLIKVSPEASKTMNFGSAGVGSQSHIAGEGLKIATGNSFLHVPYGGAAKQVTALLSGEVHFAYLAAADILPRVSEDGLRALAVASEERFSLAPDVPTLRELGIPNQNFDVWYGLLAPAKTDPKRIETLQKAIAKVMEQDDMVNNFHKMGVEVRTSTGDEMMDRFGRDHQLYSDVIDKAQIEVD